MIEIYAIYVEALTATEGRRQNANQIYLSISLAVVTAQSTIESFPQEVAAGMILFVSVVWVLTIASYRALAQAKFKVVLEMEANLPFSPYTKEWGHLPRVQRSFGFTRLEKLAPIAVAAFAISFFI